MNSVQESDYDPSEEESSDGEDSSDGSFLNGDESSDDEDSSTCYPYVDTDDDEDLSTCYPYIDTDDDKQTNSPLDDVNTNTEDSGSSSEWGWESEYWRPTGLTDTDTNDSNFIPDSETSGDSDYATE